MSFLKTKLQPSRCSQACSSPPEGSVATSLVHAGLDFPASLRRQGLGHPLLRSFPKGDIELSTQGLRVDQSNAVA